jgi:hypothetical protein
MPVGRLVVLVLGCWRERLAGVGGERRAGLAA